MEEEKETAAEVRKRKRERGKGKRETENDREKGNIKRERERKRERKERGWGRVSRAPCAVNHKGRAYDSVAGETVLIKAETQRKEQRVKE